MLKSVLLTLICIAYVSHEVTIRPMLINLGRHISYRLLQPIGEKGQGELLIRDFFDYYNNLDDVKIYLIEDDERGMPLYQTLLDEGGPPHLAYPINYEKLQDIYDWTDDDIYKIKDIIQDTVELWDEIQKIGKEKHIATTENQNRVMY